jgi:hypothetical protein
MVQSPDESPDMSCEGWPKATTPPIRETNGEVDRLLGEVMVGKSVKSESSCRLSGFWLLYASSSRNIEGVMILYMGGACDNVALSEHLVDGAIVL